MAEVAALGVSVDTSSAIQALNRLQTQFKRVTAPLQKVGQSLRKVEANIEQFAGKLDQLGSKQFQQVLNYMNQIATIAKGKLGEAFTKMKAQASALSKDLQHLGNVALKKLTTSFKALSSEIGNKFNTALKKLRPNVTSLQKTLQRIGKEAKWWANEVKQGVSTVAKQFKTLSSSVAKSVSTVANSLKKNITTFAKAGLKNMVDQVRHMNQEFKTMGRLGRVLFRRTLPNALKTFYGRFKHYMGMVSGTMTRITNGFTSLRFIISGLIFSQAIQKVIEYADAWKVMLNQIKVFGDGLEKSIQIQEKLFQISQRSLQALDATAVTYSRLRRGADELGLSMKEMLYITEAVGKSFVIAGSTAKETRNATYQLAQAFGQGALRGDELRSILEMNQVLAKAIAREFKVLEPNMDATIGKLVELGREGLLTPSVIAIAIFRSGKMWDKQFSEIERTVDHAMTQMRNSMIKFLGTFDRANNATATLVGFLSSIGDMFDKLSEKDSFLTNTALVELLKTFGAIWDVIKNLGSTIVSAFGEGEDRAHDFARMMVTLQHAIRVVGEVANWAIGTIIKMIKLVGDMGDVFDQKSFTGAGMKSGPMGVMAGAILDLFHKTEERQKSIWDNIKNSAGELADEALSLEQRLKELSTKRLEDEKALNKKILEDEENKKKKIAQNQLRAMIDQQILMGKTDPMAKAKVGGWLKGKTASLEAEQKALPDQDYGPLKMREEKERILNELLLIQSLIRDNMTEAEAEAAAQAQIAKDEATMRKAVEEEALQIQIRKTQELESEKRIMGDQHRINMMLKADSVEIARQTALAKELRENDKRKEKLFRSYEIGSAKEMDKLSKKQKLEVKARLKILEMEHKVRKEMLETQAEQTRKENQARRDREHSFAVAGMQRGSFTNESNIKQAHEIQRLNLSAFEMQKRLSVVQAKKTALQELSNFLQKHELHTLEDIHSLEGEKRDIAQKELELMRMRVKSLASELDLENSLKQIRLMETQDQGFGKETAELLDQAKLQQNMLKYREQSAKWYKSDLETNYLISQELVNQQEQLRINQLLRQYDLKTLEDMATLDPVGLNAFQNALSKIRVEMELIRDQNKQGYKVESNEQLSGGEQVFESILSQIPGFQKDALKRFRALSVEIYRAFTDKPWFTWEGVADEFSAMATKVEYFFDNMTRGTIWDTNDLGKRIAETFDFSSAWEGFGEESWVSTGLDKMGEGWDKFWEKRGQSWDEFMVGVGQFGDWFSAEVMNPMVSGWNGMTTWMSESWDGFLDTSFVQSMGQYWDQFVGFMQFGEGQNQAGMEEGDSSWATESMDWIVDELPKKMAEWGNAFINHFAEWGQKFNNQFGALGRKIGGYLTTAGDWLMTNIFEPASKIFEAVFIEPVKALGDVLGDWISDFDEMIFGEGGFAGLMGGILGGEGEGDDAVDAGAEMAANVASGKQGDPVTALVIELVKKIIEKMEIFQRLFEVVEEIFVNVADLLDTLFEFLEPLLEAFYSLIDDIFKFLKPIFRILSVVFKTLTPVLKLITDFMGWIGELLGFILSIFGMEMDTKTAAQQDKDIKASQEILDDLLDTMEELNGTLKQIEDTIRNIRYSELNLVSSFEKLAMAEQDYQRLLTEAQTGGAEEISALAGFASEYLTIAQGVEKSSKSYEIRYRNVLNDLENLGTTVEAEARSEFDIAKQKLDELGEVAIEFGNGIGEAITNIRAGIDNLDSILEGGGDSGNSKYGGKNIAEIIIDVFISVFGSIVESAAQFLEALLGWIPKLIKSAGEFLMALFKFIGEIGLSGAEFIGSFIRALFEAIGTVAGAIDQIFEAILDAVGLGGAYREYKNILSEVWTRIMDALGFGKGGPWTIPIIPGWILGKPGNLVELEFSWGEGGLLEFADGGSTCTACSDAVASGGGLAKGPSHQSGMLGTAKGGKPFLFEGGEYIINKKTVQALGRKFFDEINTFGLGGELSRADKNGVAQFSVFNSYLKKHFDGKDPDEGTIKEAGKAVLDHFIPNKDIKQNKDIHNFLKATKAKGFFGGGGLLPEFGSGGSLYKLLPFMGTRVKDARHETPSELWQDIPDWAEKAFGLPDNIGMKAWIGTRLEEILGGWLTNADKTKNGKSDFVKDGFENIRGLDFMKLLTTGVKAEVPWLGGFNASFGDGGLLPEFLSGKLIVNNATLGGSKKFGPIPDPIGAFSGKAFKEIEVWAQLLFPEFWKSGAGFDVNDFNFGNIFPDVGKIFSGERQFSGRRKEEQQFNIFEAIGDFFSQIVYWVGCTIAGLFGAPCEMPLSKEDEDRKDRLQDPNHHHIGPYRSAVPGDVGQGQSPIMIDTKSLTPFHYNGRRYTMQQLQKPYSLSGWDDDDFRDWNGGFWWENLHNDRGVGSFWNKPSVGQNDISQPGFIDDMNEIWKSGKKFNVYNAEKGGLIEYANGGLAYGPSHASGSVMLTNGGPANFQGGEFIINKDSTDALGTNILNMINAKSYGQGGILGKTDKGGHFLYEGGEYVMNRDAVNKYGVGFMEGLNSFGMGGLTSKSLAGSGMGYGSNSWKKGETEGSNKSWAWDDSNMRKYFGPNFSKDRDSKLTVVQEYIDGPPPDGPDRTFGLGGFLENLRKGAESLWERNTRSLFGRDGLISNAGLDLERGFHSTNRQEKESGKWNSSTYDQSLLGGIAKSLIHADLSFIGDGLSKTANNLYINDPGGGDSGWDLNRGYQGTVDHMNTWQEPWRGHQGSRALKGTFDHWGKTLNNLGMNKPDGTGDRWDFNRGAQGTLDSFKIEGWGSSASQSDGTEEEGGGHFGPFGALYDMGSRIGRAIIDLPDYLGGLGTGLAHHLGEEWETAKNIGIGQYLADGVKNTGEYLSGKRKLFDDSWGRGALYKKWYDAHKGGARPLPQLHQDALALNSNIPRGVISSAKFTTIDRNDVQGGGLGALFGGDYSNFSAVALDDLIAVVRPATRGGHKRLRSMGNLTGNPQGLMFGDLLHEMAHVHQYSKVKGNSESERFSKIVKIMGDGGEREAERVRLNSLTHDKPDLLWSTAPRATRGGKTLNYSDPYYDSWNGSWRSRIGGGLWADPSGNSQSRFQRSSPYEEVIATMWHFLPFLKTGGGGMMRTHMGHDGQQHKFGSVGIDQAVAGMGMGADAWQGMFPMTDPKPHPIWGIKPTWNPHNVGWAGEAYPRSMAGWGEGGLIEGRMYGGPIQRNKTYMVGESGPELFRSNVGGSIIPNATNDNDLKNLVRELIDVVRDKDTDVHVYTDLEGQVEASVDDFRSEIRERINREQRMIA